jgi:sulfur-carrier protein
MIDVRLFATFREKRFKQRQMALPDSRCLSDLLSQLEIPSEQVGILLVNGHSAILTSQLNAGDVVSIFPALGGG